MTERYVFGFLGARGSGDLRKTWNALLAEQGIDGFFDCYRAVSAKDLELRLSEMFLLERSGYLLSPKLGTIIMPLLDKLDASAEERGEVDTVLNEGGVMIGYFLGDIPPEERLKLWMSAERGVSR